MKAPPPPWSFWNKLYMLKGYTGRKQWRQKCYLTMASATAAMGLEENLELNHNFSLSFMLYRMYSIGGCI